MRAPHKVTVSTSIRFDGMAMESTSAALEIINRVMATHAEQCKDEIKQALEAAGARKVKISMMAY